MSGADPLRITEIFLRAGELEGEARERYLEGACGGDRRLRAQVDSLLRHDRPTGSIAATPVPSSRPDRIGPYRILDMLGEGGMGVVYLAEQTEPVRRRVALKLIKLGMDTAQVVARFEAERQALALMDHPCVAKVLDAGATEDGRPYFVMEYVKGEPITEYCDRNRLTTRERLDLFVRVCAGVQHAHQKAVIHRDLKPTNVLVTFQDGKPVPKIIDFGVAKATAQRLTERTVYTELGVMIGTPEYMSPEQANLTAEDVDTRTDVYSLGVMLYELLTGALPFDSGELRAAGFDEIRRRIREEDPPRPSTRVGTLGAEGTTAAARARRTEPGRLLHEIRGDLDWIVMKAIEKDRGRRYGSPSDLVDDLRRHLSHEPVLAGPPSAWYKGRKFVLRHRFGVTVSALAVIASIAFVSAIAVQAGRIARERDRAKRVSGFLEALFTAPDPDRARGKTVTAREILDEGAARIERELADEPEVRGSLMFTMGQAYKSLGIYAEAERLLNEAITLRRRTRGARDRETLAAMASLADLYGLRGRAKESEPLLREAFEILRATRGPDDRDTLRTQADLADTVMDLGRYEEAEALCRDALGAQQPALGPDHSDTLFSLNLLGAILNLQGRRDEAEKIFREAWEARRRSLGEDHPSAVQSMVNVAVALGDQGRHVEAERLCREAVERYRKVSGPEHPETLWATAALVRLVARQGRNREAESLAREVLAVRRRVLGDEHSSTLDSMTGLALVLEWQGRHEESGTIYRDVLEAQRRVLGEDHPETLWSMNNLAFAWGKQGKHGDATKLYREAIERRREVSGIDHPDTLWVQNNFLHHLLERRLLDEAETVAREMLDAQRRRFGLRHPEVATTAYNAACIAARRGRGPEALEWLRQAVEAGYRDGDWMSKDEDLISLRGESEFDRLLAASRRNEAAAAPGPP